MDNLDSRVEIARAILETLPDELPDEQKREIAAVIAVMVTEEDDERVN